jgi:hypothetical protein
MLVKLTLGENINLQNLFVFSVPCLRLLERERVVIRKRAQHFRQPPEDVTD